MEVERQSGEGGTLGVVEAHDEDCASVDGRRAARRIECERPRPVLHGPVRRTLSEFEGDLVDALAGLDLYVDEPGWFGSPAEMTGSGLRGRAAPRCRGA